MKHKNRYIFALVARVSAILSTFLLSVGLAIAQPAPTSIPAASLQEQQELERLREERRIREQVQSEVSQTTTLFNVMLATLAVLLAAAIVGLFLLRRAVIREVAELVRVHLKELGELEGKIARANQDVKHILREAETMEIELRNEAENFQQEIGVKRDNIFQILTELSQSKKQALT
ncbi:MAG TPA: hypothetical protein V6C91_14510, partial [Coleofasciculaceae cyanobacterium]